MIDFKGLSLETIQSQYAASPRIMDIVRKFAERIDPNPDIDLFYREIFDLDTAQGIGLDIWGAIVNIPRFLIVEYGDYFGFQGSLLHPFDQRPFYNPGGAVYCRLEDEAYRRLIYYKAMANIGDATIPTLNRLLKYLYDDRVYVLEIGVMEIRVMFERLMTPYEYAFYRNYALFAKGAGVGWELYQIPSAFTFGFQESGLQPFNQGAFDTFGIQRPIGG